MKSRLLRHFGWALAALGAGATTDGASEVVVDFAEPAALTQRFAATGAPGWSLEGEAVYDRARQNLRVVGGYQTTQPIEPEAPLSYRMVDAAGEVLEEDGVRFAWAVAADGSRHTRFDLELPHILADPLLSDWTIEFNAVKEGEYWYRDRFPEMEFPVIAFANLPARDHFVPMATWVPRYLPAGFRVKIPAWFRVGQRDARFSAYRPSLDLTEEDPLIKVTSQRLEFSTLEAGAFWGVMPLGPQEQGVLLVRPGMVWENLRWYEASDWFPRERVEFISPLTYLLAAAGLALGGLGWGLLLRRIPHRGWRWAAGLPLGFGALWWAGNLLISGFWSVALAVGLAGAAVWARLPAGRGAGYAFAWIFMVWMEVYWGTMVVAVGIQGSALVFSAATWAILLLPLLLIPSRRWSWAVGVLLSAIWVVATVVAVSYHEFFFDFPSVSDLLYAGQIGELGDSVGALWSPLYGVPLGVWGLMVLSTGAGLIFSGRPKSKRQNT